MAERKTLPYKVKRFGLLWLLGMPGVLSLVALSLPVELEAPIYLIKALVLVQPTILLSLAVLLGVQLAHRVGLSAPVAEALVQGRSWRKAIAPQLLPGIMGGLLTGAALITTAALARGWLPIEYVSTEPPPPVVRLLYGGITEEILMRWGVMTLLLWLGWRFGQRRKGTPAVGWVIVAIGMSAGLFAVAHLPYAIALGLPLTPLLVGYLLLQNALFALVAGYLYWRYGLESAIVAHLVLHLLLLGF